MRKGAGDLPAPCSLVQADVDADHIVWIHPLVLGIEHFTGLRNRLAPCGSSHNKRRALGAMVWLAWGAEVVEGYFVIPLVVQGSGRLVLDHLVLLFGVV